MAPELRHLRYLLAVAEHGSFTRAAEELRVSQPTLSQQIRQLERTVGVQLLDRSGRTVRATDAGAVYLHHARRALRDLAAAERAVLDVADLSRGTLRLAMTPTFTAYLLGPLVAELHLRHPGITLDVKEMTQAQLESGLLADALDLAVAFAGPHLAGIAATELFTETLGMAVGDAHPLAGRTAPLPAADLAQCDLALLSGGFATRTHIDGYFAAQRIAPRIAVEANSSAPSPRSSGAPPWPRCCPTPWPATSPACTPSASRRPCPRAPSYCCAGRARTRARRPALSRRSPATGPGRAKSGAVPPRT